MNDSADRSGDPTRILTPLEICCSEFLEAWQRGGRPNLADFLARSGSDDRALAFAKLLELEIRRRRLLGEDPTLEEYRRQFPEWTRIIEEVHAQSLKSSDSFAGRETEVVRSDGGKSRPRVPDKPIGSTTTRELMPSLPLNPATVRPVNPGQIGKYRVVEWLGGGGFGNVWKAHDPDLDRLVAIKVLRSDRATELNLALLKKEGRKLAQLASREARIVAVHESGTDVRGQAYLVTEYLPGGSLYRRARKQTLEWRETALLVAEIADTLAAAHAAGILHRDIKPENILLDARGRPYLADFGLAATAEELDQLKWAGTIWYMSPEHASGLSPMDARSDIYSLGVVLYRLLTGTLPCGAANPVDYQTWLLDPQAQARPLAALNPAVPAPLQALTLRCLEKSPAKRIDSAKDLAEELRRIAAPPDRRRRILRVAAVVSALVFAIAVWGFPRNRQPPLALFSPPAERVNAVEEEWKKTFGLVPFQLAHAGNDEESAPNFSEAEQRLEVVANNVRLIGLSEDSAGDLTASVHVRQLVNRGRFGFFWGARYEAARESPGVYFNLLWITTRRFLDRNPEFEIRVWECWIPDDYPAMRATRIVRERQIERPSGEQGTTLGIRLKAGELVGVQINDQEMPDLLEGVTTTRHEGSFGLFCDAEGVYWFTSPRCSRD